jgi:RHS repeat-associated protein
MRLGNQVWEHTNFNTRLQPTEIGIGTGQTGAASVDRLKLNYDYGTTDNNGNVKSQTITVPTVGSVTGTTLNQCYTYDEFNRLKVAEEKTGATPCAGTTVWTQKYMYDQQGNRRFDTGTTIPVGFPNPTINTANNNRIDTSQGYVYDLAGNVTQDLSHLYMFDAEERQTKVDAGATGQYFYDGTGQRIKSITSAGTTIYVYDAMGRLVAEYTTGNATGSGTSYITADALGSPRVITAQDQSVKARHDYLPFGEEIPAGYGSRTASQGYVADGLRQKFTGKERDSESGLDYFGARYYASALGRFTGVDSFFGVMRNPQTLNRYAYVLNNPLRYIDPTGHSWWNITGSEYDGTDDKLKQKEKKEVQVEVDDNGVAKPKNKDEKVYNETLEVNAGESDCWCVGQRFGNWWYHDRDIPNKQLDWEVYEMRLWLKDNVVEMDNVEFTDGYVDGLSINAVYRIYTRAQVGIASHRAKPVDFPDVPGIGARKTRLSGKEGSSDVPSWAEGKKPSAGESGKDFAKRLMDEKYGAGSYDKGPGSEFNKLKKYGDRHE